MKIEKISETQIKFELTQSDLDERNIKLNEIFYGSEKTHQLFQEMMRQASSECDFNADNAPLMAEAMPINGDSVIIVVTKITDVAEIEQRLHLMPQAKESARFKRKGMIKQTEPAPKDESVSIFSFDLLDSAAEAAASLQAHFDGSSRLYKNEGRYYLLLQNENQPLSEYAEALLYEYGRKHTSSVISAGYLEERGEVLIADRAVEKLAVYLG